MSDPIQPVTPPMRDVLEQVTKHLDPREARLRMDGWLQSDAYRKVDGVLQWMWFIPETGDTQWVPHDEVAGKKLPTTVEQIAADIKAGTFVGAPGPLAQEVPEERERFAMTLPPQLRDQAPHGSFLPQRTTMNVLPPDLLADVEATRFKPVIRGRENVEPCRTISDVLKMALGVDNPKQLTVADFEHVHSAEVNLARLFLGAEDPAWAEWYRNAAAEQAALRAKRKNLEPSNAADG